jgi:peptide methionine sulfoxide reductase MsrB
MPIKYGELTIIYNKEEISIFTDFLLWMDYNHDVPNKSKYVFLFEDGEICETNDKLKNFNFKFLDSISLKMPKYFEKKKEINKCYNTHIYFYKNPILDKNGKYRLEFKELFNSYTKYNSSINIPSFYNSIYYCHKSNDKPEIFGIIRTKSNEYMPRFQFAYDDEEFTKEEVVYLINYIFNNT